MQLQETVIPDHVLKLFDEVNSLIDVLPLDFRQTLTDYMHLLAWQITENIHDTAPDEHFEAISKKFKCARNRVLH